MDEAQSIRTPERHEVAGWVRAQRLPSHEKLTLLLLFEYAGPQEDGRWACWPSMETLAQEAGAASIATVRRHIASMESQGIVEREARQTSRGRTTTNRVVLLVGIRSPMSGWTAHPQAGVPLTDERISPLKPQKEAPKEAAARAPDPALVGEVCGILSAAGDITDEEASALILDYPDRPHKQLAFEVAAWAKRQALHSVPAAYRSALAKTKLRADPPPPPVDTVSEEAASRWLAARQAMAEGLEESTFTMWLEPLTLLGTLSEEGAERLVLGVPLPLRAWVADRFSAVLTDAISGPWELRPLLP